MFFDNVWFQNLKFEDKILDIFLGGVGPQLCVGPCPKCLLDNPRA